MHTALLTEEGTLHTNDGRSGCSETASNDGGECSGHAEKETDGICHKNKCISPMSAQNLTKEAFLERAARGEWTARKARGTVLECARYDERTLRVGRRA
ncbi:hypothetical protein M404DRAFT_1008360 [Pisolithus tinctorius Marx 270]|uniref:Uncharacterized protein n=1 Tax=Pisolithus tinctorius Marx 270 TaxID=870435 RepID=A0A0C3NF61_PISTI|nr:hypothetical protein M404DRAFT_1008360 [Pisolithus tinctorius Marx 270]